MRALNKAYFLVIDSRILSTVSKQLVAWAPLLILLLALGLRLHGINWDQGGMFHPDERAILMKSDQISIPSIRDLDILLDAEVSPWNPNWFPYGSLPLYLIKGVQLISQYIHPLDIFDLRIAGRFISALADSTTVFLLFILGKRFYGRNVGLLAACLTALAVLHVQLSHFYTVDTLLTLATLGTIFFSIKVAQHGNIRDSILAGIFISIGLTIKVSIIPIFLIFIIAHGLHLFSDTQQNFYFSRINKTKFIKTSKSIVASILTSFTVFVLIQPYAILDWPILVMDSGFFKGIIEVLKTFSGAGFHSIDGNQFVRDIIEQSGMVHRLIDFPYTRQYIDTPVYWYQIKQLAIWGLGIPLGIIAWLAVPYGILHVIVKRRKSDIIIISWIVLYFLLVGSFDVKFIRYLLPITPLMILIASGMLIDSVIRLRQIGTKAFRIGLIIIAGVVLFTGLYSLSYQSIYTRQHTAQEASDWIRNNVPKGSVILKEHWEEGLPNLHEYQSYELPMYDEDSAAKIGEMSNLLSKADYIVLYSQRLYATLPRLKERYPISSNYYELLFSNKLGYELVNFQISYPSILGVTFIDETFGRSGLTTPTILTQFKPSIFNINMGVADESFTVYDHPKVLIFRNINKFSSTEIENSLLYDIGDLPDTRKVGLMLSEEETLLQQSGGTWNAIIDLGSWTNRFPVVAWLLLIQGISILALPLTFFVFRSLPDRGYLFSKILGLLIVAYIVWLLASLKWMSFSTSSIILATGILFLVSMFIMFSKGKELVLYLRQKWRLLITCEALFLIAFIGFLFIRMANPDLWHPFRGGEKPMDFAYLNAILKSTYMPPYDPWFSGGFLNYYYMGQFIVAMLIKAVGINPTVAYNMAIPLFFALTIGGSFSLVYNLCEATRVKLGGKFPFSPIVAGMGAAFFVAVVGNLDGMIQISQSIWGFVIHNQPFSNFDYWHSTRLMTPDPPGFEINEFPFFTFLFGDLHAHMMSIPITLLVITLVLSLLISSINLLKPQHINIDDIPVFVILSLALGFLNTTNTWDYPTYILVTAGGIILVEYIRRGGMSLVMLFNITVKIGIVYAISQLLFLPFIQNYQVFYKGIEPTIVRTSLWQFMLIHGLFIFIILSFLFYEGRAWFKRILIRPQLEIKQDRLLRWSIISKGLVKLKQVGLPLTIFSLSGVGLFYLLNDFILGPEQPVNSFYYDTVIFIGFVILLSLSILLRSLWSWSNDSPYLVFAIGLLLVALLLVFGVEFVRVQGDIDRMNTVFKFYTQVWILFALVSAYFLWRMYYLGRGVWGVVSIGKTIWLCTLAILILSASIYTILGTQSRLKDRFQILPLTLDGSAFVNGMTYQDHEGPINLENDYDALEWLRLNIEGSPVILEGLTPTYRWGGRVSVYTGLPSVIGWEWHQTQQRFDYMWAIDERLKDVNRIYSTDSPEEALNLLNKYGVKYVYVGELERLYYPKYGLHKFDIMEGNQLEKIYNNSDVDIYKVIGN